MVIRAALILVFILLNLLACFGEDIYLTLYPLEIGQKAPFALRTDRPMPSPDGGEPGAAGGPEFEGGRPGLPAGEVLVPFLKTIDERDLRLARLLERQRAQVLLRESPLVLFANIWMIVFLGFFLFALPRGGYRRAVSHPLLLALLILQAVIFKALLLFTALPLAALPLSLLPLLIVGLHQGRVTALGTLIVGALLASFFVGRSYDVFVVLLVTGLTAIMLAPKILRLHTVLLPCFLVGVVQFLLLTLQRADWAAIARAADAPAPWRIDRLLALAADPWAAQSAWALAGGAFSGALAVALLPAIRVGRTIGSTISLRRFADLDQPLLKRLFTEAPGTYQHSMNVAYLAQAAGSAVGADTLLLRIGAYFHDIGKIRRPDAYVENQLNGVNLHDALDPYESIEIITGHVSQGLLICRDARLPRPVIDLIQQHHGTQAVDFFYEKARRQRPGEDVGEDDFRYPGPKPQTLEAALLMIADAVEAASRSLTAPGRSAFEQMVRFIVVKRIADGQFSECVLDTREIDAIIRSLVDALEAAFHARIRYPWQQPPTTPPAVAPKAI